MLLVRISAAAMAGVLIVASGCTSMSPVVRAQSPTVSDQAIQQTAHVQRRDKIVRPIEAAQGHHTYGVMAHPVYDSTIGEMARTQKTYHTYMGSGPGGAACPSGQCPPMYGAGVCPDGNCGRSGCGHPICIRDSRSFTYKRPNDLRYPMQNQIGGVTVWPYYTHKGPSDFFRQ